MEDEVMDEVEEAAAVVKVDIHNARPMRKL